MSASSLGISWAPPDMFHFLTRTWITSTALARVRFPPVMMKMNRRLILSTRFAVDTAWGKCLQLFSLARPRCHALASWVGLIGGCTKHDSVREFDRQKVCRQTHDRRARFHRLSRRQQPNRSSFELSDVNKFAISKNAGNGDPHRRRVAAVRLHRRTPPERTSTTTRSFTRPKC